MSIVVTQAKGDDQCNNCNDAADISIKISPYPQLVAVTHLCEPCTVGMIGSINRVLNPELFDRFAMVTTGRVTGRAPTMGAPYGLWPLDPRSPK